VRLASGCERNLDADMELAPITECEPDAASRAQRLRLLELFEAQQLAEEAPRFRLAAGRRRELDVV
jgi:hypothetical protein